MNLNLFAKIMLQYKKIENTEIFGIGNETT